MLLAAMLLLTTLRIGYCPDASGRERHCGLLTPSDAREREFAPFWHLFAPPQTPRSILQRLRAALTAATREDVTPTRLLRLGMVPILDTPQESARIVSDPQERLLRCPTTSI